MSIVNTYHLSLFHGTNDISSAGILKFGFKDPDKQIRDDDWLGKGVYFFREDCEQAFHFAKIRYGECKETKSYHVIHTDLEINGEQFLNLDSRSGMSTLLLFIKELEDKLFEQEIKLLKFSPAKLRNFIMNNLPPKYAVIKRTFPVEKSEIFDNVEILNKMKLNLLGVQVCIRDVRVITKEVTVVRVRPKRMKNKL